MEKSQSQHRTSAREFQRTYKACTACRLRKARCVLGPDGRLPCARCRRQYRDCFFSDDGKKTLRSRSKHVFDIPMLGHFASRLIACTDTSGWFWLDRPVTVPGGAGTIDESVPGYQSSDIRPLNDEETVDDAVERSTSSSLTQRRSSRLSDHHLGSRPIAQDVNLDADGNRGQAFFHHPANYHGIDSALAPRLDPQQQPSPASTSGLASSVMRTVVSSGNDALNILFEAASAERNPRIPALDSTNERFVDEGSIRSPATSPVVTLPRDLPQVRPETLRIWSSCRFVTMGWLTARDAITYIDL